MIQEKQIKVLIERLEKEINKTPSGEIRNLLTDINITLHELFIPITVTSVKMSEEQKAKFKEEWDKVLKQPQKFIPTLEEGSKISFVDFSIGSTPKGQMLTLGNEKYLRVVEQQGTSLEEEDDFYTEVLQETGYSLITITKGMEKVLDHGDTIYYEYKEFIIKNEIGIITIYKDISA